MYSLSFPIGSIFRFLGLPRTHLSKIISTRRTHPSSQIRDVPIVLAALWIPNYKNFLEGVYFRNFYIWNTYLRKKNIRKNLGGGRQESTHTLRHNLSVWYSTSWSRCTNGLIKSPIIFALSVIATVSVVFVLCRTLCSFRKLWFGKPLHSPTIFVTTEIVQGSPSERDQVFVKSCLYGPYLTLRSPLLPKTMHLVHLHLLTWFNHRKCVIGRKTGKGCSCFGPILSW